MRTKLSRDKVENKIVSKQSEERDHSKTNCKHFHKEPIVDMKLLTSAYKLKLKKHVLRLKVGTNHLHYFYSKDKKEE